MSATDPIRALLPPVIHPPVIHPPVIHPPVIHTFSAMHVDVIQIAISSAIDLIGKH